MSCQPISFGIPAQHVLAHVPLKTRAFALYEPGGKYLYDNQAAYYAGYQEAYFALTTCKDGWDCLRHYEILAQGCMPYFLNLEQAPSGTMLALPKELILEAMYLPGVDFARRRIDGKLFDVKRYQALVTATLAWTRERLTTKAIAQSFCRRAGIGQDAKILFLSGETRPDYQRCLLFHGLRTLFMERVVDYPRLTHLYTDYPADQPLYGKGFTYARLLSPSDETPLTNEEVVDQIQQKKYDYIIYGSVHRGLPFYSAVMTAYPATKVIFVCGEDLHECEYRKDPNRDHPLFLREY